MLYNMSLDQRFKVVLRSKIYAYNVSVRNSINYIFYMYNIRIINKTLTIANT